MIPDDSKIETYKKHWKARFQEEEKMLEERKDHLRSLAFQCAQLMYEKYNVKAVYLIGSLLPGRVIWEKTDIDLVVDGLSAPLYFKCLSELYLLLPKNTELDLIPLEDASVRIKENLNMEGELIGKA